MVRPFTRTDPPGALEELNRYATRGFPVHQPLKNADISGYGVDEVAEGDAISLPAFTPLSGRWGLLAAFLLKSTDLTQQSSNPYNVVSAALRVGENTRVLGTYSQRSNALDQGTRFDLLGPTFRGPLLIPDGGILEAKIMQQGWPRDSLEDAAIVWWLAQIGG